MNKQLQKITRKQQAKETKEKLLEVSFELIKKYGFDKVKISDICQSAGVSTGAFYHHIKNKAGIVVEAYAQCDEYFIDEVFPKFRDRTDIRAIAEYIGCQMKYAEDLGVDICTQIYKAQLTEGTEFFLSKERGLPSGLIKIVEHLQQEKVIKTDKTAKEIGSELLVISRGILYNWCQNSGNYDIQSFAKELIGNYMYIYTV